MTVPTLTRLVRLPTRVVSTRLARRAARARHNDYDYACRYWWGDRNPKPDDTTNRDFGDAATAIYARRCVVCRPYNADEDTHLLGYTTPTDRFFA